MVEAAAFFAVRSTPAIASLRVMMSAKVSRPSRLWRMRCNSPFSALVLSALRRRHLQPLDADRLDHEILGAGAHRRHHVVDAAMGGLHDDGDVEAGFAHLGQNAHAVEAGHDQVEHDGVDRRARRARSTARSRRRRYRPRASHSRISAPCFRPGGAAPHRRRRSKCWQPWLSPHATTICLEFGALWPTPINALLNVAPASLRSTVQVECIHSSNKMTSRSASALRKPTAQKDRKPRTPSKNPPPKPRTAKLPEWNLADLYSGIDAPEIAHDLDRLDAECVAFETDYKGKLAEQTAGEGGGTGLPERSGAMRRSTILPAGWLLCRPCSCRRQRRSRDFEILRRCVRAADDRLAASVVLCARTQPHRRCRDRAAMQTPELGH